MKIARGETPEEALVASTEDEAVAPVLVVNIPYGFAR